MLLSFLVSLAQFLAVQELLWLKLTGFGGGIMWVVLTVSMFGYCLVIRSLSKTFMQRRRMWDWGKRKFGTWDDFFDWIDLTEPYKLETILINDEFSGGQFDKDWEPDLVNGGVKLTEFNESPA